MGLIKAAAGAGGGVLADQWKEYFYCDAINADVLAVKGRKKVTKRSSNTKGDEDIITSGSVIAVADGQAMMIVDQGKVVEAAFEPGEFVYDSSAEPTIFAGSFGDSVCKMFANMAKRFTFGIPVHPKFNEKLSREDAARLLFQHQGADRQQVRNRVSGAVPRAR